MGAAEVAVDRAVFTSRLSAATARRLERMWLRVDRGAIVESWRAQLPDALSLLSGAQVAAARSADAYVDAAWEVSTGSPTASVGRVNARALAGVASDGRSLATLLQQPAIQALTVIGRGGSVADGMASGLARVSLIAGTQVADAGRAAERVAMVSRPEVSGYVRVLRTPSCGRCAILAGKWYRWSTGFQRHPGCDCVHQPAPESHATRYVSDPQDYFDSLTEAQRRRYFGAGVTDTVAGGGDLTAAVNATRPRSGLSTAAPAPARRATFGEAAMGKVTPERAADVARQLAVYRAELGAGRGSDWMRSKVAELEAESASLSRRFTPEQIVTSAHSREQAIADLKAAGYLM